MIDGIYLNGSQTPRLATKPIANSARQMMANTEKDKKMSATPLEIKEKFSVLQTLEKIWSSN